MSGRPRSAALQAAIDNNSSISTQLLTRLAETVTVDEIADGIKELLTATTWVRSGKETMKEVPDFQRRESGLRLWLSYQVGMPVQRVVEVHQRPESDAEVMDRLLSSPTAREELRKILDEAEARHIDTKATSVVLEGSENTA